MTKTTCDFSYQHYRHIFETALECGYNIITLEEYFKKEYNPDQKTIVNRLDVDADPARFWEVGNIFKQLGIKGSIFFRLHAPTYNLLKFDTINMLQWFVKNGVEIGLHSDLLDLQKHCNVNPKKAVEAELAVFRDIIGCPVVGIASHGDATGYNNLHFWNEHKPEDFGLLYEAYDDQIWSNCRYVSDSNYSWKAYDDGIQRENDTRCACEHIKEGPQLIYLLTHAETFYWQYVHEGYVPAPEFL